MQAYLQIFFRTFFASQNFQFFVKKKIKQNECINLSSFFQGLPKCLFINSNHKKGLAKKIN
jgi:hypothetical protein